MPFKKSPEFPQSTEFTYLTDIIPSDDGYVFHNLMFYAYRKVSG